VRKLKKGQLKYVKKKGKPKSLPLHVLAESCPLTALV